MFEILKVALLIAGALHLVPLLAGLTMPRVLHWGSDLGKLDALTRQLIWVHGAFIAITVLAFGLITMTAAESMLQGTPLAVGIAAFIGLFWFLRLLIQLFYFDAHPWLTNSFRTVGYNSLTFVFGYFSVVYLLTAGFNLLLVCRSL
jgi:hypothetical protein